MARVEAQFGSPPSLPIPHYAPRYFLIFEVDGIETQDPLGRSGVDLPGGAHELTVGTVTTDWLGQATTLSTTIVLEAAPGRVYQLRGAVRRGELAVWIVDQENGEVVAGEPVEEYP